MGHAEVTVNGLFVANCTIHLNNFRTANRVYKSVTNATPIFGVIWNGVEYSNEQKGLSENQTMPFICTVFAGVPRFISIFLTPLNCPKYQIYRNAETQRIIVESSIHWRSFVILYVYSNMDMCIRQNFYSSSIFVTLNTSIIPMYL